MANTTADKLAKLESTKADLKAAILEKGGSVGDVFSEYPAAVRSFKNIDTYEKEQIMASTVPPLYGLGSDAVPSKVLEILSKSALYKTADRTVQIGTLNEGEIIYLNENGSPVPFYVAKQDYESANNTSRTLVVRKEIVQNGQWNASNTNTYNNSTIDSWMNGSYLQTLDSQVRSAIGTTNIPLTSPYNSGVTRVEKGIFALSLTELGKTDDRANTEGSKLPIASDLIISGVDQWTRTPNKGFATLSYCLTGSNTVGNISCNESRGYRPAFTLPKTFNVSLGVTTGLFDVLGNLLLKLPLSSVQIATGSYVGTGKYGSSNPNSLTFDFDAKAVFVNSNNGGFAVFVKGTSKNYVASSDSNYPLSENSLSWPENSVKWWSETVEDQLNESGTKYYYTAIG